MTNMPGWKRAAPELKAMKGRIAVGLHLNLTTGAPLGSMPELTPSGVLPRLGQLLNKSLRGHLPQDEVRQEIERQLDAFVEAYGEPPSFVDGHQHVHVLPSIRQSLNEALKKRGYAGQVWLRDPSDRIGSILRRPIARNKALIVKTLAFGFAKEAHAAGFETNEGFSGFAPFDLSVSAGRIFEEALSALGARPLVMCHPGYPDQELRGLDPAVDSRLAELRYLRSDDYSGLMDRLGIMLSPRLR